MVCIYCGSSTQVINSRLQKRLNSVWRRRKCQTCGRVFTSTESADYEKSWIVEYPDQLRPAPFLRDKLLMSLYRSLEHRPDPLDDALGLTDTVIGLLSRKQAVQDGRTTSTAIATGAYDALKRYDKDGATMYRAFHADVL